MGKRYINAPVIAFEEDDTATGALLRFYTALGWNGKDSLSPTKVRTSKCVYETIRSAMLEAHPNNKEVGLLLMQYGPSVNDDTIPAGKVQLLKGWAVA